MVKTNKMPEQAAPLAPAITGAGKLVKVDARKLTLTGWNPRLTLGTATETKTLTENIRNSGFDPAFPLMVGTIKGGPLNGKLVVLRGHRRLAAILDIVKSGNMGKLDPTAIPAIDIGEVLPEAAKRLIIDHTTRPLSGDGEFMKAVQNLLDSGMTQHQVADFLRLGRGKVQQYAELNRLPPAAIGKVLEYFTLRAEGTFDPETNPAQPVFNGLLLQQLRAANNARLGLGKSVDGKPADPAEFDKLWTEWKKDNGRTLTGETNGPKPLSHKETLALRGRIADYAKPEFKEALTAVLDVVLRTKTADALAAYLNQ